MTNDPFAQYSQSGQPGQPEAGNQANQQQFQQYPPFQQAPQHAPQQPGVGASSESFFKALMDLSFSQFITVKFAKYIYILAIALHVLWVLIMAVTISVNLESFFAFLGALILGSIMALFSLIGVRLGLELAVSIIRTAQNSTHIVENTAR
ncbi:MAG: DUF4282 domain-containing protein [Corynebacterium sp.]|uniref:DUF4282 domain-containing protein n=1 Tax=Corynebacterium sp. TaxID=1720 RepID=UPI0026DF3CEA|nr:DUF4282 domain-containing protein [Corynebacterium sp.]MDO5670152.1 DUF4282 domain-containing protein [Corynebacterium sp.]